MAIQRSSISASPIIENYDVTVEFLIERPSTEVFQTVQDTPGKIVAYYDGLIDAVELYVVDKTGYRYLRVT
jgi:hypothetical protein